MTTAAFITYNTVGNGLANGWHDAPAGHRAFVVQNTKGETWGAADPATYTYARGEGGALVERRMEEIGSLWGQLQKVMPELDHVIVYVGANGSQRAIALAANLPVSKVTFVGCDCGFHRKVEFARAVGLAEARWVECECGGHSTMRALFEAFMRSGAL